MRGFVPRTHVFVSCPQPMDWLRGNFSSVGISHNMN
jgi:hypothetical protein